MNPKKVRRFVAPGPLMGAVLAGLLFAALMSLRLGLFQPPTASVTPPSPGATARESWMSVWQSGRKIGYSHQMLSETDSGYRLTDRTLMRINTMGLVQDIDLKTAADLNPDLGLSAFEATLASGRFSFAVQGRVAEGTLHITTENGHIEIPLAAPLYLSSSLWDSAAAASLAPGQSIHLSIFDPISLGNHTVEVTYEGRDAVLLPDGETQNAGKYSAALIGAVETAWIDDQGTVLKEEGLLGISLVKDSRENALNTETLSESRDLTLSAAIAADVSISAPEALTRLELKMDGIPSGLSLDGGRQSFANGVLTVVGETLPDPPVLETEGEGEFLEATVLIQSDHPEITAAAEAAVKDANRPLAKARQLVRWVHDQLEKRPVLSVPSALDTLRQGAGDCNEHAVLLAALARATGIPARVEAGLVYMDGRFYYHAWNSLYLGRWVTADALMDQMPADVTHVRLAAGEDPAEILGAIGQITLKVLGTSP